MLEIALIISLTMAIVEVIKRALRAALPEEWVALLLPLVIVAVAAGLNAANMAVFDPTVGWREAVKLGIAEGAAAAGIYSLTRNMAVNWPVLRDPTASIQE